VSVCCRTPFRIVIEVLREPMLALLLGGGTIYLLLGDVKEALILLGFAMLSIAMRVWLFCRRRCRMSKAPVRLIAKQATRAARMAATSGSGIAGISRLLQSAAKKCRPA